MLERILREIPKLTDAVVGADVKGDPSYDITTTGAADAVREAGEATKRPRARPAPRPSAPRARPARSRASPRPRVRSRAPSPPRTTSRSRATTRSPPRRSSAKLSELSQIDLAKIDSYERKHQNRTTVLEPHHLAARRRAVAGLRRAHRRRGPGRPLRGRRGARQGVRSYERAHKNRAGVLKAAEREHSNA